MPNGGAFDSESAFLANALLGNAPEAAVLEIPLMGGEFECNFKTSAAVVGAKGLGEPNIWTAFGRERLLMSAGGRILIPPAAQGVRSYIAVPGGFLGDPTLGSVSGQPVSKGELPFTPKERGDFATLADRPSTVGRGLLRFVPGPQAGLFDLKTFGQTEFTVANDSDRRGIRLQGLFEGARHELPSEPACFGAIQITPSGMAIILGPDGPTIGGYPKIGVVISADLAALGQLAPTKCINFEQVSWAQAEELNRAESLRLHKLRSALLARL